MSYKGELLSPVLVDYPESKFGGFLAVTDYKDPVILDEINAQRLGAVAADQLLLRHDQQGLSGAQGRRQDCASAIRRRRRGPRARRCATRRPSSSRAINAIGNRNWLGLDNQGRDVVARVIYGFRISVLFGLILTMLSAALGRHGRRHAGLFRRPHRPHLPALPGDLVVDTIAVRADHHLVGAGAGLLDAARHAAAVRMGEPRRRGARRVPARAQLRVRQRRRARSGCRTARSCGSTCCRTPWWRRSPSCRSSCRAASRR